MTKLIFQGTHRPNKQDTALTIFNLCLFVLQIMDKPDFFRVWDIYQAHWGREEQQALRKVYSARLLERCMKRSDKMKALRYMHHVLRVMWESELFVHPQEVVRTIRDFADACLGEDDYDEETLCLADYSTRMRMGLHRSPKHSCSSIHHHAWKHIQSFLIGRSTPASRETIYHVNALVVLPSMKI